MQVFTWVSCCVDHRTRADSPVRLFLPARHEESRPSGDCNAWGVDIQHFVGNDKRGHLNKGVLCTLRICLASARAQRDRRRAAKLRTIRAAIVAWCLVPGQFTRLLQPVQAARAPRHAVPRHVGERNARNCCRGKVIRRTPRKPFDGLRRGRLVPYQHHCRTVFACCADEVLHRSYVRVVQSAVEQDRRCKTGGLEQLGASLARTYGRGTHNQFRMRPLAGEPFSHGTRCFAPSWRERTLVVPAIVSVPVGLSVAQEQERFHTKRNARWVWQ